MNIFQIVLLDVILILFPILIYLIYLAHKKSIYCKKIYETLVLLSSFFLLLRYGIDKPVILPVLILNLVIFLSYLNNRYILAILFSIFIIINYYFSYNNTYILLRASFKRLPPRQSARKKVSEKRM